MTERHDSEYTPAERSAQAAVRALAAARPDPAYRARIGRAFVAGDLRPVARARPAAGARWMGALLAAAAAFVVVAFAFNRGPDWTVIETSGTGTATVDGKAVAFTREALTPLLRRGGRVVLPEGATLDLVAPGALAVSLTSGTDATLPAAPNRWWSRAVAGRVSAGEAFIKTGPRFHGATLDVRTKAALAHVTGTALAVLTDPVGGTCVCVMEGRVSVTYEEMEDGRKVADTIVIPQGERCICRPDGETIRGPILPSSEHALHRLGRKSAAALGR